jgi:general secretion pathway protein A
MYHEFYNLAVPPFENTPDPRFFFASEQHREALAAIEYTIRMRKGFVLVTGDIGSGKTTVGRTLCERCADQAQIVQVMHGHQDGLELLRQILRCLGLRHHRQDDHARMLERLRKHLFDQLYQNRPVVLLVDEAQTLRDEALEELRLLSNFDTATDKPIQVVLIGQPEIRQRLRSSRLAALRQRIVLAKQLRPLNQVETGQYIAHRLRAASIDPQNVKATFHEQAVADIHRFTGGVPRLINVACDNCMLLAFVREAREITPAMVRRSIQDMVPSLEDSPVLRPQQVRPVLTMAGSL